MCAARNALDEHENRVAAITAIAIEAKALSLDKGADEITPTDDPNAEKVVYAKAFQAWADGRRGRQRTYSRRSRRCSNLSST
jgi:hypothetical protein